MSTPSPQPPAPTDLLGHFQLSFAYDVWAMQQMLHALDRLPAAGWARRQANALAAHLVWASRLWYARVRGEPMVADVRGDLPPAEMAQAYEQANERWQALLAAQPNVESLAEPIRYTTTEGTAQTTPLRDVLTHVLHHGSHHRAQMAALIRQGGGEPPLSDYIYYHRALQAGRAPLPPVSA